MSAKKTSTSKRTKKAAKPKRATLKVGTTIVRTFKGKTYKLVVTEDGFRIGKKKYSSLTAAAKGVSGYLSISGPVFWRIDDENRGGK